MINAIDEASSDLIIASDIDTITEAKIGPAIDILTESKELFKNNQTA